MNISSAVVKVKEGSLNQVLTTIDSDRICEVALHENNRIIVTIEANNLDGEIKVVKQLESITNVLSVEIVYAYSEDELDEVRNHLENSTDIPEMLNDESLKAGEIRYQGDLRKKI